MSDIVYSSKRTQCSLCGSHHSKAQLLKYYDFDVTQGEYFKCFACDTFVSPVNADFKPIKLTANKVQLPKATKTKRSEFERRAYLKTIYSDSIENSFNSGFAKYFMNMFGLNLTAKFLYHYSIGADCDGNTVFWYANYDGELSHCKIVSYDGETGKRRKNSDSNIYFVDKTGKKDYRNCLNAYCTGRINGIPQYEMISSREGYNTGALYQEYFLNPNIKYTDIIGGGGRYSIDSSTKVIVLESEKSVLLCSLLYPKYVFVASGGASGITQNKAKLLQDKQVFVMLDNDKEGEKGAKKTLQYLPKAKIINPSDLGITAQGGDIFDLLIEDGRRIEQAINLFQANEDFFGLVHAPINGGRYND